MLSNGRPVHDKTPVALANIETHTIREGPAGGFYRGTRDERPLKIYISSTKELLMF